MEKNRRSGGQSGVIVKNKSSSGCLIVRKKSEDVCAAGSSGAQKVFHSKKEKKRPRMVMSDSGSSDELLMPPRPRRRVGPETIRVCNGLNVIEKGVEDECEFDRKKDRAERVRHTEDGLVGRNEDRKRNRLDVFEFDEYDGEMMMRRDDLEDSRVDFGRRRFSGSMPLGRTRIETEFESSSSRHVVDKREKLYFEGTGSFNQGGVNRFGTDRDSGRIPTSLRRENYMEDSDEPIRLQGKNGVLKVMANKKKKVGEPVKKYDRIRKGVEENRSASRAEDNVKRNISMHSPSYLETEVLEKPGSFVRTQKNEINLQKSLSAKKIKDENSDSEDSDTALKLGPKRMGNMRSTKEVSSESEKTLGGKLTLSRIKEGKVKRGSGTEKQKLRERIRGMLVDSGWKIDYRPRKNRDYLDAVYINPSGTAYWSIIKAYDALMKQLNEDEDEGKPSGDDSPFTPLPDEVLGQLTRKTRKKFEKEMKKKQRDGSQRRNTREASARKALSARHAEESIDSHEEKLSSFLKQGAKSSKNRMNENDVVIQNLKGQSSHDFNDSERPSSASVLHGRKSRKLGRCTLLVRGSNEGPNSDSDGFVPYSGKRTLLSWLIDSGTVQLSQKVQYMNRRKTKVMLEGWITRDGIHCGCCSKILTVLKFEIHAGSTLRQPFQNIYVDSGVSLLQCQIDAWNKLEESERIGFQFVDIEGDDPNDDTCGICGDGGNLICCDGCPSTFHQNCLNIQMLPPGDWHCPNCTCKFCGLADEDVDEGDDTTASELPTCSMCEKKYHILCMQETDALAVDSNSSAPSFCGQKCRELFEQLQKYLGVKHELESGFSWSLIHRTVEDSDMSLRGLPQRVECNSKLAVAMTVMDECFLPIVDRRSGINLIHNVLYNSGSNFNRLNYSGFYTAILERGDELISAASIRFHGTQLAEMPFIGTRHIYRRQGMCRRLFSALQSALCSLKVEKLIIPAIAELMHTWTGIFGFTKLEDSLKLEMLSLNMLVFPGIDMLQKWLLEKENIKDNITARTGSKPRKLKVKHGNLPELVNKSDMDSSADHDTDECADGDRGLLHGNAINGEVSGPDNESKSPVVKLNDTPMHSGSLNVSLHVSVEGAACDVSPVGDKLPEAASDGKCLSNSDMNDIASELENKPEQDSPVADISPSTEEGDIGVVHAVLENKPEGDSPVADISPSSEEGDMDVHVELENKPERDSPVADISPSSEEGDVGVVHAELENKPERDSPAAEISPSSEEGDMGVVHAIDVNVVPSHEAGIPVSSEETKIPDSESRNKLPESDFDKKGLPIAYTSHDATEQGNKPESDSLIKDKNQFTIESDMDDAHMVNANVAAPQEVEVAFSVEEKIFPVSQSKSSETAYDKNTIEMENKTISDSPVEDNIGSFKGDMDVNAAASHEVEIPVSVDGTICSDSKSGDKCLETPNRPVLDSVDSGTQRQTDGDTDDSCAKGNNVAAAHEHKIPVSVAGSIISDSQSKDIVSAESYLEKKCLIPETSHYKLQMEHTPLPLDSAVEGKPPPLDSAVEDKPPPLDSAVEGVSPPPLDSAVEGVSLSPPPPDSAVEGVSLSPPLPDSAVECKPPPLDSAVECKPHPEPALSSGQIIAENNTGLSNENPVSSTMDSDNQITCDKKEHKLSVTSEAGSEATHREESCPHPGCDSIQSDTVEGKTGSSSD